MLNFFKKKEEKKSDFEIVEDGKEEAEGNQTADVLLSPFRNLSSE